MFVLRNYLLPTLVKLGPPGFRRFMVNLLPIKNVRRLRDIINVLHNTSVEILEARRRALLEGDEAVVSQIGRKDITSILSMCSDTLPLNSESTALRFISESEYGSVRPRQVV